MQIDSLPELDRHIEEGREGADRREHRSEEKGLGCKRLSIFVRVTSVDI